MPNICYYNSKTSVCVDTLKIYPTTKLYTYIYIYIYIYIYVYIFKNIYICMKENTTKVYVCMICIHTHIYIYIEHRQLCSSELYICIYIYIHIFIFAHMRCTTLKATTIQWMRPRLASCPATIVVYFSLTIYKFLACSIT